MSLVVPFDEIFAEKKGLLAHHPTWQRVELEGVCTILNGYPFKSSLFNRDKGFPVVRIRDLGKDNTKTRYDGQVPKEVLVENGDLLIGMDGIFRCVEWQGGEAGLNQRVCKIVPNGRFLDRKFLLFGINGYLKAIEAATSSVTVGHLSSRDILRIPFPLPPVREQRRIVAKLEKLLNKVDACHQRLAKIPILLKRFRQSVLAAACSGRLTADGREENLTEDAESLAHKLSKDRQRFWEQRELLKMVAARKEPRDASWKQRYKQPFAPSDNVESEFPATWKPTTVSQVAFLDVGFAFKSSEFSNTGIKLLRGENLEPGKLRWSDTKYWPEDKLTGFENLLIEEGEIILALDRPVISSGLKIARVTKADLPCVLVQRMMRFKMIEQKMTPWLYFNLRIPAFIRHVTAGLTGSDLPHVTGTGVAEYSFGLPPLAEQQDIVRRVEMLFALADQIEARYAKAAAHVEKLTQSILAKAFRGELVPQDPNDEPASALLERIRKTAKNSEPKRKAKRTAFTAA